MSKHAVAAVNELPPGTRKLVNVKGRAIAIFNIKGEFFALFNRCPHQGGSLCHGPSPVSSNRRAGRLPLLP